MLQYIVVGMLSLVVYPDPQQYLWCNSKLKHAKSYKLERRLREEKELEHKHNTNQSITHI